MKQAKIWGMTRNIWDGKNVEINGIEVISGGYCSKHKHIHKYNLFLVINGELDIEVWRPGIVERTVLKQWDSTIVEPGLYHRFSTNVDTIALEIYWVDLLENDIEREDQGGINLNNRTDIK